MANRDDAGTNGQLGETRYGVSRAEVQREIDRAALMATTEGQLRWAEHGRQHAAEAAVLAEVRADVKALLAWQDDIGGQMKVLKWLLMVGSGVMIPTLAALVAKILWG